MKSPLDKAEAHNTVNSTDRIYILSENDDLNDLIIKAVDNFFVYDLRENDLYSSLFVSVSKKISKKINFTDKDTIYRDGYEKLLSIKNCLGEEKFKELVNEIYNKKINFLVKKIKIIIFFNILNFPFITQRMYYKFRLLLMFNSEEIKKINMYGIYKFINKTSHSILLNV